MDFDLTKENIQPLRGGRNATQLEIALQAAHSQEYQQELLHQRQEFENAIRNYMGDDPLDNYYQYIQWVEQSYPKHGHEGNLIPILEDCLGKFENDKKYTNDRRYCKIWIKYIDMQRNPIELYQMLYKKGICRGCADLYIAWSYYHEANSDFVNADDVFKLGKKELAQPYPELAAAHENMILAAGAHSISGVIDEGRLNEQRQALVSLRTYRSGRVGSVRTPAANPMGLPSTAANHRVGNVPVQIYSGQQDDALGAASAASSILSLVKKDAVKENITKPGAWTVKGKKYGAGQRHRTTGFAVAEDVDIPPEARGIILPKNFFPSSLEDFSQWKSYICVPDPDDPTKIPMYCKKHVYIDPTTEYSMEEIRGRHYTRKHHSRLSVPLMETEQAIQSITGGNEMDLSMHDVQEIVYDVQPGKEMVLNQSLHQQLVVLHEPNLASAVLNVEERPAQVSFRQQSFHKENLTDPSTVRSPPANMQSFHRFQENASFHAPLPEQAPPGPVLEKVWPENDLFLSPSHPGQSSPAVNFSPNINFWRSNNSSTCGVSPYQEKKHISKFNVFQESFHQEEVRPHPKGSAMKTPLNEINHEDLAETGSRGGMDAAAAAQPADGAKRLPIMNVDDDSSSRFSIPPGTPNTEIFYIDAIHVSTPNNKQSVNQHPVDRDMTKKQLFPTGDPKALSVILEEKSTLSSSSGTCSTKSSNNHHRINAMDAIAEENPYQSNLAQNMKANAALREQFLNSMKNMDCDTQPSTPTSEVIPVFEICDDDDDEEVEEREEDDVVYEIEAQEHVPYSILPRAPSDPFKPSILERQLQHVGFPGRHRQGYMVLHTTPKICVRKEPCTIGNESFLVDKLLGKGTFGSVYKAIRFSTREPVALKIQKPPNRWEFYICREIQNRLGENPIKEKFMSVHIGYFSDLTSVLLSDFSPYGSLLDIINLSKTKLRRAIKEPICLYLAIEMLNIVQAMHEVKIIHADIKPDNFLVTLKNNVLGLQLIDFGCSIDMSLYPEDSMFMRKVTTEDFVCCEMRDDRPWSYHTDLFCVAATAHVMLFDKYIQIKKTNNIWSITQKFLRYWRGDVWNIFFNTLLNMQDGLPDIDNLKQVLTGSMYDKNFDADMRELINTFRNQ